MLTRTVLDTAVALDAIAGYEPGEHHTSSPPPVPFAEAARRPPGRVRIGLAPEAPLGVPVDAEPLNAARRTTERLVELGLDVEEKVPDWEDVRFSEEWETFAAAILQHLIRIAARLHGDFDAGALEPATRRWALERGPVEAAEHLEAAERLRALNRRILVSWPSDLVLLTPTLTRLPVAVADASVAAGVTDDAVRFSALVRLWNVTGQPAISLPLHETADGVPIGVQLIGPLAREDLLLSLAAQPEQIAGFRPRQPAPRLTASS